MIRRASLRGTVKQRMIGCRISSRGRQGSQKVVVGHFWYASDRMSLGHPYQETLAGISLSSKILGFGTVDVRTKFRKSVQGSGR